MKSCPICKTKFVNQGLKSHIINTAEREAYKQMKGFFIGKGKQHSFSKMVVLRNMPHFAFIKRNIKIKEKFEF